MTTVDSPRSTGTRWVRRFEDADPDDVALLGGKGAGLARMCRAELPVPPGFVITTEACREFGAIRALPPGLMDEVRDEIAALERRSGRTFGAGPTPLLVSVRSGAPVSMPGMMDTILDLGICDQAAAALEQLTEPAFVLDVARRFQRCFGEIVLGADPDLVDEAVADIAPVPGTAFAELFARHWRACGHAISEEVGETVPDDPWEQLEAAVTAVLRSWNSRRAVTYRRHQHISDEIGTAVVVQAMVFGNLGSPSGTGVVFTRNPVTGERALYGEFLEGGQGEDVVSGTADPETIADLGRRYPEVAAELTRFCEGLELAYEDALDIEYTVERGTLYMLQVRSAKRTPEAAIVIAGDILREGRLTPAAAVRGVTTDHVRWVERPIFNADELARVRAAGAVVATGIGASPGHACGALVLDAERAVQRAQTGEAVILARPTTSPVDLHGLIAAAGIITARGGATSHAAVVARALATPCVVGCGALCIDQQARTLSVGEHTLSEGEQVSLDGETGELILGTVRLTRVGASGEDLALLMERCDEASQSTVLARVTTPEQATAALERGAAGIVTGVDDVLATTGHLVDVIEAAVRRGGSEGAAREIQHAVADAFTPLLQALGDVEVDVRTIDVRADESRELVPRELLDEAPQLSMPVGDPDLLRAQMAGLAEAAQRSGYPGTPRLVVRNVTDTREAQAIQALSRELDGARCIAAGIYATSPRALLAATGLAEHSEVMWIELRALQAAMFGLADSQLITAEPLDAYLRSGMLGTDPRRELDPTTLELLRGVVEAQRRRPECRIGVRLSGQVSEEIVARLYGLGVRVFAVALDDLRVARLALGKAAWA